MNNYCKSITRNIQSFSTILIVEEAIRRGIKVVHINNYQKKMSFLELSFKNHFEYIKGQNSSKTSCTAFYATENKALTKSLLSKVGINVAKGALFQKENIEELPKFVEKMGYPIVVKPFNGSHGELVFVGIRNKKECDEAARKIFKKSKYVLVEEEFLGEEFRFIASREKVLAVAYREPANVVGDGIHSIKDLIKLKNRDPMRGKSNEKPLVKIKIDSIVRNFLSDQDLTLDKIIKKGKKVYLRKNSNISTGGDAIDVTDQVHSELKKIAVRAIKAIPGLAYAGVDLITNKSISKKPAKNSYIIIELNCSPGIDMHHFPSKGKSRNVARGIIDILFPETNINVKVFNLKSYERHKNTKKYIYDQLANSCRRSN